MERKLSYLLLCNKLPQNLATQDNTYLLFHIFCVPEIRHSIAGFPPQEVSQAALGVDWTVVISRLNWKEICSQVHEAGFSYSFAFGKRSTTVPFHGISPTQQLSLLKHAIHETHEIC